MKSTTKLLGFSNVRPSSTFSWSGGRKDNSICIVFKHKIRITISILFLNFILIYLVGFEIGKKKYIKYNKFFRVLIFFNFTLYLNIKFLTRDETSQMTRISGKFLKKKLLFLTYFFLLITSLS